MTEALHDYADKIAKLLRKAESTTPEEAEALTAMAERLMIKHGIDEAVLAAKRAKAGGRTSEAIIERSIVMEGIYAQAFLQMGHEVCRALGQLSTFQSKRRVDGKEKRVLHIVGFEGDVTQAEILVTSLMLQSVPALRTWWKNSDNFEWLTGMEKFKERRDFMFGFGTGAATRIRAARRDIIKETKSAGTEVALVDRGKQVQAYMDDKYTLRSSRLRISNGTGQGRANGHEAGLRANTGGTSVGGTGRKGLGR